MQNSLLHSEQECNLPLPMVYMQALLRYYNSSLLRENGSGKIVGSASVARIVGGMKPTYGITAPKVMYFSARGPDPEDDSFVDADIMKPNLVAPGNAIWGAWSPLGIGTTDFQGTHILISPYKIAHSVFLVVFLSS